MKRKKLILGVGGLLVSVSLPALVIFPRSERTTDIDAFRGYTYYWNGLKWCVAAGAVVVAERDGQEYSSSPAVSDSRGHYVLNVSLCNPPATLTLRADYQGQYAASDVIYHPGNGYEDHDLYMLPY
ncbi:MAG: hypothetical protein ACUVWA_15415 [Candidatus Oleimicrobiaceae bacterium]